MNQISFDPLDFGGDDELAHRAAKAARDEAYRTQRKSGIAARRWVLRGQLKKYAGFGIEDGRVRDVYYLTV
jgi:hypothetical protein